MTKPIPPVSKFMTAAPHSIGLDRTLAQAHALLRSLGVRHLPVLDGGKLVGLLTLRDLHLIETLKDVDPDEVTVEDAMSAAPYTVAPEAPLDQVCSEMAEHKHGSAVVVEKEHAVGIFTTVDACRAVVALLREQ